MHLYTTAAAAKVQKMAQFQRCVVSITMVAMLVLTNTQSIEHQVGSRGCHRWLDNHNNPNVLSTNEGGVRVRVRVRQSKSIMLTSYLDIPPKTSKMLLAHQHTVRLTKSQFDC